MKTNPLGSFPIDKFLSEYWQKKPLLIRNALPGITSPVSANELAGLACEDEIESRIIIQNETKKLDNKWELKHGPFDDKTFTNLPTSHWTLLVQAVDHWASEAAEFLDLFTFIPRWRIDDLMVSYATNGGGVGPHFDNYDVFLVQTDGQRKWQVGEQYDDNSPLIDNLPVSILKDFKAVEEWTLDPGDILYVPPGFGHNGIAVGDNCVTCSVGFRAPSHNEILREYTDYVGDKISESFRYTDKDLIQQNNTGEISQLTLENIQQILRQYAQDTDSINEWFGRYITTPKYSQPNDTIQDALDNSYSIDELNSHLSSNGKLMRNESSRFAFQHKGNRLAFFVDGECIKTSDDSNSLVEILCSEIELNSDMFSRTKLNLELLLELLNNGALYIPEQ